MSAFSPGHYFIALPWLTTTSVPLARPIPVEDVARTILFLASEKFSGSVLAARR